METVIQKAINNSIIQLIWLFSSTVLVAAAPCCRLSSTWLKCWST